MAISVDLPLLYPFPWAHWPWASRPGLLEFYYDDTQQLQSDMGDHGAKGRAGHVETNGVLKGINSAGDLHFY